MPSESIVYIFVKMSNKRKRKSVLDFVCSLKTYLYLATAAAASFPAFCPDRNMAPNVGPMRGDPSNSATSMLRNVLDCLRVYTRG